MTGTITEDYEMSLRLAATDGMLSEQRCLPGDSITEWRSGEQVENGATSTSPPYFDTDDDDDCGPKPCDLYGRFTWKIENFSTINKRELRSNAFEVGGYKWYILIYPQGCDVCNHLSLFLCVANHDKLLPGWSHFAQFTIAVVNKDPKKSKYSDTLHRFWKKEHDWGWKKFMELSKVYDGFIVADTLVIKAQVQVIREKADHPFRCLDGQYRRELVRVYLSNVEQICRRFMEEKVGKLNTFVEDKMKWSSFHAFWLGIDTSSRRRMSGDKTDAILKVVVKHFFIEKEVTSTLVMDSLYSGLKSLEFQSKNMKGIQSKNMKGRAKLVDLEELPAPMVHVDKELFVLADDVILLIERVISDSLPQLLPSKDDKCLQNRTKEGSSGEEINKDSIERDERRLMELGRRTIEIFILFHIFSSLIEVSYKEAVALKRQEELIREEEAAGQAENELKSKRGGTEKEKRAKKKQAKQKRNNRKGKDRGKDERCIQVQESLQEETTLLERILDNFSSEKVELATEKIEKLEDVSDASDTRDDVAEADDRDNSPINWGTDISEIHLTEASGSDVQNGHSEKRSQSVLDDSSSTCSTDSVPSAFIRGSYKGTVLANHRSQSSPNRGKNHRSKETHNRMNLSHGGRSPPFETTLVNGHSHDATGSKVCQPEPEAVASSLKSEMQPKKDLVEKEEDVALKNKMLAKDQVDAERQSSSSNPGKNPSNITQQPKQSTLTSNSDTVVSTSTITVEPSSCKESPSVSTPQSTLSSRSPSLSSSSPSEAQKHNVPAKINNPQQSNAMSRPSSAPLIPAPRSIAPVAPTVQVAPLLSRSVSAAGRLGTEASPSAPSYIPQSYRNAIIGKTMSSRGVGFADDAASSGQSMVHHPQSSSMYLSSSMLPPQIPARKDQTSVRPGLTFGCLPEVVNSQHLRGDDGYYESTSTSSNQRFGSNLVHNMERLGIHGKLRYELYLPGTASRVTPHQVQGTVAEEFPHLDIINDLLEDEQNVGRAPSGSHHAYSRQYSLPGNLSTAEFRSMNGPSQYDQSEQYYEEGGFFGGYSASGNPLQGPDDGRFQQLDFSSFANSHSQFDGSMRNHWPYGSTDPSMRSLGNGDASGYPYHLRDYLTRGQSGYVYRPAKGP